MMMTTAVKYIEDLFEKCNDAKCLIRNPNDVSSLEKFIVEKLSSLQKDKLNNLIQFEKYFQGFNGKIQENSPAETITPYDVINFNNLLDKVNESIKIEGGLVIIQSIFSKVLQETLLIEHIIEKYQLIFSHENEIENLRHVLMRINENLLLLCNNVFIREHIDQIYQGITSKLNSSLPSYQKIAKEKIISFIVLIGKVSGAKQLLDQLADASFTVWDTILHEVEFSQVFNREMSKCGIALSENDIEKTLLFLNRIRIQLDSQIVALLLFIHSRGKGLLEQIRTGEEKTLIVGIATVFFALCGQAVDVLSSNRDLTIEGERKCRSFFELLKLESGHICSENDEVNHQSYRLNLNPCQGNIIYGEVETFQRDILEEEFNNKKKSLYKLKRWVDSAFQARIMTEDDHFVLNIPKTDGQNNQKQKTIVVLDKDTGVEQYSARWSHGLAQFLELKYRRKLSVECLKAVFIANKAFFQRYKSCLYDLTGTLGSENSQSFISDLYYVKFADLSTSKKKCYNQLSNKVAFEYSDWLDLIAKESIKIGKKRPVLIVCENVGATDNIWNELIRNGVPPLTIEKYRSDGDNIEERFRKTPATTDPEVNKQGGLHVILNYPPENVRVEEQVFGRTARNGAVGTGQFILQVDKFVYEHMYELDQYPTDQRKLKVEELADIILERENINRDNKEAARLSELKQTSTLRLEVEELFEKFNEFKRKKAKNSISTVAR
ncbi:unnamed protein product [Rotaria magnacalcarata]|uniref:SecA family profile domain-containing protein n=1 Tax=Rotaria magnacalcarata TaxID=392030 RepID=A0A8S2S331_9BILA|nr:unnamed protein product [Rotaria magnacalcarata]